MGKTGIRILLAVLLALSVTACAGAERDGTEAVPEQGAEEAEEKTAVFAGGEREAYRDYLREREGVGDLYFACLNLEGNELAVLALTHEKHAVDAGEETITANHIVLNNFLEGEVVQVTGSSMDTYSGNVCFFCGGGRLWVPVYGGVGSYTVSGRRIAGEVYATEGGVSTKYSVTGKKRTEPETVPAETVSGKLQEKEKAEPVRFFRNTEKNRESVFGGQ